MSLTPGLILFGPTRVFGGVTGNKVIEFSVKEAAYTWERYNVVYTYKWDRYSIKTTEKESWEVITVDSYRQQWNSFNARENESTARHTFAKGYSLNSNTGTITFTTIRQIPAETYGSSSYDNVMAYINGLVSGGVTNSYVTRFKKNSQFQLNRLECESPIQAGRTFYRINAVEYADSSSYSAMSMDVDKLSTEMTGTTTEESRGSYIDQVTSSSSGAFPSNGKSGGYWYVSAGSSTSRGTYIDDVTATDYDQYPDNGISGSYWYIRK